jgi:acyl-[acyl-carrier-protein]-phospholipid O-acyltransferase/long-chain-fatty-acid--[acyl-carrier-protein] ligase
MVSLGRWVLRSLLRLLYRVSVTGLEHYAQAGSRVLLVANHTSFLDALLLAVFMPDRLTFAINTEIARRWWMRPLSKLVDSFPLDPTNPYAVRALIRYIAQDRRAAIFPEGRITVTGSLMKIYPGPGLVADKSGAMLLPVRIEGTAVPRRSKTVPLVEGKKKYFFPFLRGTAVHLTEAKPSLPRKKNHASRGRKILFLRNFFLSKS